MTQNNSYLSFQNGSWIRATSSVRVHLPQNCPPPPQPSPSVSSQLWVTSGDENHLCGASLHASRKIHSRIHHAHGIDYNHDHIHAIGGTGLASAVVSLGSFYLGASINKESECTRTTDIYNSITFPTAVIYIYYSIRGTIPCRQSCYCLRQWGRFFI